MGIFRRARIRTTTHVDGKTRVIYRDWSDDNLLHSHDLQAVINLRAESVASLPLKIYNREKEQVGKLDDYVQSPYALLRKLVRALDTKERVFIVRDWHQFTVLDYELEERAGSYYNGDIPFNKSYVYVLENGGQDKIKSLKHILHEQREAWRYRRAVWEQGGRVGSYISRPAGAKWDEASAERFTTSWHEFTKHGARQGETPVLEDGMKIERFNFSAKEDEWQAGQIMTRELICNAYNVPVEMFNGQVSRDVKRYFYTDTLAPLLFLISETVTSIIRDITGDNNLYARFNIDARLQGSFEEQASALSTAIGAPWLTVNEGRAIRDLQRLNDGDSLVVPLNVTAGGQASPQDGGELPVAVENAKQALKLIEN